MIVFDLRCAAGHVFEAWFGSSADYADQKRMGLLSCPVCGDAGVEKAVMAPNIAPKGNSRQEVLPAASAPSPEALKALMAKLAEVQREILKDSQWVGTAFADRARSMHLGEEPPATIHGKATVEEARALVEEGVPVAPLPFPVVPPEACN